MLEKPKLILFVVMDTARMKAVSCLDDSKTPNLNRFVSQYNALPFKYAISPSTWTPPTHVSLFTGLSPSEHKCIDYGFKLDKSKPFLPEILNKRGYKTVGINSSGLLDPSSNFSHGFDDYICTYKLFQNVKGFNRATNTIKEGGFQGFLSFLWHIINNKPVKNISNYLYGMINSVAKNSTPFTIRSRRLVINKIKESYSQNKDLFLFANLMQPHMNYNPPHHSKSKFVTEDYKEIKQDVGKFYSGLYSDKKMQYFSELYQAEVNFLDEQIGLIIDAINEIGIMEESLVVFLSDHGEHLGEHGHISHYFSVYNEITNVPFIAKFPDSWRDKLVIDPNEDIIQTNDIFSTICEMVGIHEEEYISKSFFRFKREIAESTNFVPREYEYLLEKCKNYNKNFDSEKFIMNGMQTQHAVFSKNLKLIIREKGNHELYKFRDDPDEQKNLINNSNPEYQDFVSKYLNNPRFKKQPISESKSSLDSLTEEVKRELRELGYL